MSGCPGKSFAWSRNRKPFLWRGNAVTSGASLNEDDEVEISITPAEGTVPSATLNGSSIELTENDGVYTGNFAMPGQAASLVINTGSTSGDSSI